MVIFLFYAKLLIFNLSNNDKTCVIIDDVSERSRQTKILVGKERDRLLGKGHGLGAGYWIDS